MIPNCLNINKMFINLIKHFKTLLCVESIMFREGLLLAQKISKFKQFTYICL